MLKYQMEINVMQSKNRTILMLILLIALFIPSGCVPQQQNMEAPLPAYSVKQQSNPLAKRFQDTTPQGTTAIESAMELSEKYASLSEQFSLLKQEKQGLTATNQQLRDQITSLENQLEQTQKELTEANDFLIEMRIELNNWKTDVLGFRDEMRDAETAQLEALLKILRALGGDVQETVMNTNTNSAVTSISTTQ